MFRYPINTAQILETMENLNLLMIRIFASESQLEPTNGIT